MADETPALAVLQLIIEIIWVHIRLIYELIKNTVLWFVPPSPKNVSKEIVLITGAGHGMGQEMALRFSRLGALVICVDINPKGNDETFNMIIQEKNRVAKYECDVTNRTAVMQLAEKVKKDIGDVTILVNNAGIMPCKSILAHSEKEVRTMMDVNVNGNIWMIQAFLPAMIENNHGHIVAMSSMAGRLGLTNLVPYCGSKFAVRGIMEALAIELYDDPRPTNGIKFTTVYPYIVNTGLCKKPRIRFLNLMTVVEPSAAADTIVDAVRRNYTEISIPTDMYYTNKYFYQLVPPPAWKVMYDFVQIKLDAHDD